MRLMIVGSDKVYAIENFYVRYIRETGVEVFHFCAQNLFYDYYYKSLLNKILFRAGLSTIFARIDDAFRSAVEEFRPDVIWVFKGMEISPASLTWARDRNIKLVNYNPDNPFIFTGRGSGNKNVTNSIGLYHLHFTYNLDIQKRLMESANVRTAFLPFGYHVSAEIQAACIAQDEVIKVCFLGNPDSQRAALISAIAAQGIEIDVYGNDWNRFVSHPGISCLGPVYGIDFWKTLYKYRVQLNFMRIHNERSHNMRTFEVPGIGAIQLAPDTPEHRMFFDPQKEIFLYNDIKECCLQAERLMTLDIASASEIRAAAKLRSEQSGYSYRDRAGQALAVIQELLHG